MKTRYRQGEALTAETVNRLIAASLANVPRDGLGTRVVKGGSGGFSINVVPAAKKTADTVASLTHPWKVKVAKQDDDSYLAKISDGKVFDKLHSDTEESVTLTDATVTAGDMVVLKYTLSSGSVASSVESTFDPFTTDGEVVSVILATIEDAEDDGVLTATQIARNHYAMDLSCVDGEPVRYFLSL